MGDEIEDDQDLQGSKVFYMLCYKIVIEDKKNVFTGKRPNFLSNCVDNYSGT